MISNLPFSSALTFRLFKFAIGHGELLLRGNAAARDAMSHNVDVIFSGVFYIELFDQLHGIVLGNATDDDIRRIRDRRIHAWSADDRVYRIRSGDTTLFVGAQLVSIDENCLQGTDTNMTADSLWRYR